MKRKLVIITGILLLGIWSVFFPYWYNHKIPEMTRFLEDSGFENVKPIEYGSYIAPCYEFTVINNKGESNTIYVSLLKGNYAYRYSKYGF